MPVSVEFVRAQNLSGLLKLRSKEQNSWLTHLFFFFKKKRLVVTEDLPPFHTIATHCRNMDFIFGGTGFTNLVYLVAVYNQLLTVMMLSEKAVFKSIVCTSSWTREPCILATVILSSPSPFMQSFFILP